MKTEEAKLEKATKSTQMKRSEFARGVRVYRGGVCV